MPETGIPLLVSLGSGTVASLHTPLCDRTLLGQPRELEFVPLSLVSLCLVIALGGFSCGVKVGVLVCCLCVQQLPRKGGPAMFLGRYLFEN